MSITSSRDRVLNTLQHLLGVSVELREAMLARDPVRIQEVTDKQEELRLLAVPGTLRKEDWDDDQEISGVAEKISRLQQSNRLLAAAFLGIYRNTMAAVSNRPANPGLYGRTGALLPVADGALLVRQRG